MYTLSYRRQVAARAVSLAIIAKDPGITASRLRERLEALAESPHALELGFDFVGWSGGDYRMGLEAMARTDLIGLSSATLPSTLVAWSGTRLTATSRGLRIITHAREIAADVMKALSL